MYLTPDNTTPWTWQERYHCFLAVLATAIFFTDLDTYVYWAAVSPLPPITWIYVFCVLALPLMLASPDRCLSKPLLIWGGGYLLLSLGAYVMLSTGNELEVQELRTRILSTIFMVVLMVIFSSQPRVHRWVRWTIVVATCMAVFNNILGASDPMLFGDSGVVGRAGGFYVNPNKAGMALMLGIVFGTGVLPGGLRIPFVLACGVGVLLTFSRGAMLIWILLVGWMLFRNQIPHKQGIGWFTTLMVAGLFTGLQGEEIIRNFNLPPQLIERLEWFKNPLENKGDSEGSSGARQEMAENAWEMFLQRPFTGYGVGSTITWSFPISTHNMYLANMADHGLIGVLLLPGLTLAVVWGAKGLAQSLVPALSATMLIWGIFSHNLLDERYILLSFALMGSMTIASQVSELSQIEPEPDYSLLQTQEYHD